MDPDYSAYSIGDWPKSSVSHRFCSIILIVRVTHLKNGLFLVSCTVKHE